VYAEASLRQHTDMPNEHQHCNLRLRRRPPLSGICQKLGSCGSPFGFHPRARLIRNLTSFQPAHYSSVSLAITSENLMKAIISDVCWRTRGFRNLADTSGCNSILISSSPVFERAFQAQIFERQPHRHQNQENKFWWVLRCHRSRTYFEVSMGF
jgi:hypothetical protein